MVLLATTRREFYRTPAYARLIGGEDYDFTVSLEVVANTQLDGKQTELTRLGSFDLTGWSGFTAEFRTRDGLVSKLGSVVLDGPADGGSLRLRGTKYQTWDMQLAEQRGGEWSISGLSPQQATRTLVRGQWRLLTGATSPYAVPVADWSTLR